VLFRSLLLLLLCFTVGHALSIPQAGGGGGGGGELSQPSLPKHELHPSIQAFVTEQIDRLPPVTWDMIQKDPAGMDLVWPVCISRDQIFYRCPGRACMWAFKEQFLKLLSRLVTTHALLPDVCMWFNFSDEPRVRLTPPLTITNSSSSSPSSSTCDPFAVKYTDSGTFDSATERVTSDGLCVSALPMFSIYGAPALGYQDVVWPLAYEYLDWEKEYNQILEASENRFRDPNVLLDLKKECVWRGSATGGSREMSYIQSPRWQLVTSNVTGLDARLTSTWSNDAAAALVTQHTHTLTNAIGLMQQIEEYNCTVDIDGNAGSQRFKQLLLSPLVVLKVASPYPYFWSRAVKAWKHYVPICSDLSNLAQAVQWVHTHPVEATAMARDATSFARDHLSLRGVYAYMAEVLRQYGSKKMGFVVGEQDMTGWYVRNVNGGEGEDVKVV